MNEFEIRMLWREDVDWIDLAQDLNTVEPWLFEIKGADPISDNSEILLDVIRCNKNNIYSDTRLMCTRKCTIFTDTIQHYKFLKKKSDILVLTFFHNVFRLQCPSIRHFRRMFSSFDFTQSETVDMPTPKSAATFRKISPFQFVSQPPISVQLLLQHVFV